LRNKTNKAGGNRVNTAKNKMKSSLQVKWYGVLISSKNTFPKFLSKKCFSTWSAGNVCLTHSKIDAKTLKLNVEKSGKEVIFFEITDKQFGKININYGEKLAAMPTFIKKGIFIKEKSGRTIAIPATEMQLKNGWSI
jgi:hypothetical protein